MDTYVSVGESLLANRCLSTNRAATVLESSPNPYSPATAAMRHPFRRHYSHDGFYHVVRSLSSSAVPPPVPGVPVTAAAPLVVVVVVRSGDAWTVRLSLHRRR